MSCCNSEYDIFSCCKYLPLQVSVRGMQVPCGYPGQCQCYMRSLWVIIIFPGCNYCINRELSVCTGEMYGEGHSKGGPPLSTVDYLKQKRVLRKKVSVKLRTETRASWLLVWKPLLYGIHYPIVSSTYGIACILRFRSGLFQFKRHL